MTDTGFRGLPGARTTPLLAEAATLAAAPVLEILETAATRDPDAIALAGLNGSLSYAAVLRLARNAAAAVAARTRPGEPVAWLLPRRPECVAVLVGALAAGRPCLILDAFDPPARRDALLAEARPALVLANDTIGDYPVLDAATALSGAGETWRPDHDWDAEAPFAVHYTSGSTGRPKGIVLSARSVLYRGLHTAACFAMTCDTRMLQPNIPVASTGLSTVFGVWSRGGRIVLLDLAREGVSAAFTLIEREAVDCTSLTTATLHMMSRLKRCRAAFARLRIARIGGGALLRSDLATFREVLPPDCGVLHAYASTEALCIAQWMVPAGDTGEEAAVPSGVLQLCHDYTLVDTDGHAVPRGDPGELLIESPFLALGEWRDGGLVPGRMPSVPERPGWRSFRTGDVLRVGADGMVRVLGRVDRQVKINNVIVHPAEIEAVLSGEQGVAQVAVVADTTPSGGRLHAFVAAPGVAAEPLIAQLRHAVARRLPPVFQPADFTVLNQLPTLPAGKVDLVALTRLARDTKSDTDGTL